jgi:hypothetical protein
MMWIVKTWFSSIVHHIIIDIIYFILDRKVYYKSIAFLDKLDYYTIQDKFSNLRKQIDIDTCPRFAIIITTTFYFKDC